MVREMVIQISDSPSAGPHAMATIGARARKAMKGDHDIWANDNCATRYHFVPRSRSKVILQKINVEKVPKKSAKSGFEKMKKISKFQNAITRLKMENSSSNFEGTSVALVSSIFSKRTPRPTL